jgi:hypothetical protein|tara:strand:- start:5 stop:442 length:438 start_codon:yes stop_codon:yes gene_type:complete
MATHSKVTGGTSGHPSTRRKPYWVENTVDLSLFDPVANDIVQVLNVPAETFVINAGIEVLTASASGVTLDLGDGGDVDRFVDGLDSTSTGHGAQVANASNVGHVYGSADTIDVKVLGATDNASKLRVWAIMCDVSGSDETASNSS